MIPDCTRAEDEVVCSDLRIDCEFMIQKLCKIEVNNQGRISFKTVPPYAPLGYCLNFNCLPHEYKCKNEGFCISIELICDGIRHCLQGDDEINCQNFSPKGFFKCRNEIQYLPKEKVCNNIVDCLLGSDEINCFKNTKKQTTLCNYIKEQFFIIHCLNPLNSIMEMSIFEKYLKGLLIYGQISTKKKFSSINLKILRIFNNKALRNWTIQNIPNIIEIIINDSDSRDMKIFEKQKCRLLQNLTLSNCNINSFNFLIRIRAENLLNIKIYDLNITYIEAIQFRNLKKLIYLELKNLHIKEIEKNSFYNMRNLTLINLNKMYFSLQDISCSLKHLEKIKIFFGEQFQLCCIIHEYFGENVICKPKKSLFLTCNNILPTILMKFAFWFVGIFGILANFISFFNYIKNGRKLSRAFYYSLFVSDLL